MHTFGGVTAFDRRLRLLVMDAIERIEIDVRAQLAYHHAGQYHDPFAYCMRKIAPHSRWPLYVDQCLADFPNVSTVPMGFPPNWRDSPLWWDST